MAAKTVALPNLREMFVPDSGYTIFDMDLDRADLQVVVWEAGDEGMKDVLRSGADMHLVNASVLGCDREMAKRWVHGTNYGGSARTMAINCGIPVYQSELFQKRWFGEHPGIKEWHVRTGNELLRTSSVSNKFGFRRIYFDRPGTVLSEALAWVPQSTVAHVINSAWLNIERELPQVEILLQVHDSLVGQFPTALREELVPQILGLSRIIIPYEDPLIIPASIKTSEVSWGDCK